MSPPEHKIPDSDLDDWRSCERDTEKDPDNKLSIIKKFWLDRCNTIEEGDILEQSCVDNQPRVINLGGRKYDDMMLRVGDWSGLPKPREYQMRHVHLAKVRQEQPYRVCLQCLYSLGHKCDLFPSDLVHCDEACIDARLYQHNKTNIDHEREEEEEKKEMFGHVQYNTSL